MFDDLSYPEIGVYFLLVVGLIGTGLWYYHSGADMGMVLGVFADANSTAKGNVTPPIEIPLVVVNVSEPILNDSKVENTTPPAIPEKKFKYIPSWTATPKGNATACLHGALVLVKGNTVCVRSRGGEEQRNYTAWIDNQTQYNITNGLPTYLNITDVHYAYYQENCTNVTEPYTWDGYAFIVNSTHPLTCDQIKAWNKNSMMNGGTVG